MGTLGLGQGFKPVGDFVKTFIPGAFGHAGVHVGVLVGLTGDGGFQVGVRGTDGQTGGGVSHFFQVFQVTVCVAGFAFRG